VLSYESKKQTRSFHSFSEDVKRNRKFFHSFKFQEKIQMKDAGDFEEFIKKGIVKKQSPNKFRAEFLIKESEKNYSFLLQLLDKFEITDGNANTIIKLCYDILMETIRAKMLLDGYNASGFEAHKAEVAYLKVLGFEEKDIKFADQMRYYRNGMLYYGTSLDKEYTEKVLEFTKRNYLKLKILK